MPDDNMSQKSRRCWHRVMSGIERGGQLRFLTLTSTPDSPPDIQRSWRKLHMRLRRRGLVQGYIRVTETTESGLLHLHILFRGSYISQRWISATWKEIHGAPIVDIRPFRLSTNPKKTANYMAKYMSKDSASRYSWSWGWVWRGFCRHWLILKRRVRQQYPGDHALWLSKVLQLWQLCLHDKLAPDWDWWELMTMPPGPAYTAKHKLWRASQAAHKGH